MLREAELFVVAEGVLTEVLGRIRADDRAIVLPPLVDLPGPSEAAPLWSVVEQYAYDDACVPGVLAGEPTQAPERRALAAELDGDHPQVVIERVAAAATSAARAVADGDALVPARDGPVPARHHLLRLAVNRSLVAHYVAAYLGSTACPLPEELARPLWELTQPDAARWRALGIFHDPLPVPHLASWRDTFLLSAGHLPHPLGH